MKSVFFVSIFILSLFVFAVPVFAVDASSVVINEVAWIGTETSANDEWVELYNNTEQDINLEGWGLYEAGGETLIEPLTGVIKAGSYYLIERTDDNTLPNIPASQEPSSWGGHGLNNNGEYLQLKDKNSRVIDEVNCSGGWFAGDNKTKQTMERKNPLLPGNNPDNWQTSQTAGGTPKAENSIPYQVKPEQKEEQKLETPAFSQLSKPAENSSPLSSGEKSKQYAENGSRHIEESKEKVIEKYPSGIVINEILPSPEGPDELEEWIELFNTNDFEVNLSGWQIADTVGSTKTFTFPEGTSIKPNNFLIFWRKDTKIVLNNSGDTLKLLQPNGNTLNSVVYEKAPLGQSYNREGTHWVWSSVLTPGRENIISELEGTGTAFLSEKEKEEIIKESSETGTRKVEVPLEEEEGLATLWKSKKKFLGEVQNRNSSNSSNFLFVLLIAIIAASFLSVIVLILKKRLKKAEN